MGGKRSDTSTGIRARLRIGIAAVLLAPGVSKFLTYGRSVQFFETLGLPAPAVLVLAVGAVEIGIAVFLVLDRAPRAAAVTVVPVMIVAAVTAGPTWQKLWMLIPVVVLIGIDTKPDGIVSMEPTT
jgi:uncharacterized membrane protein YphA (DoxX/SURF4 family)